MGNGNVLSAGLEELNSMKQALMELEELKAKDAELTAAEGQMEKEINSRERQLADKIAAVTKNRRTELEKTYDEQVEKTKNRIRKVRSKKEKQKSTKVSERIASETSELWKEKGQYGEEIQNIYQTNKIPKILNNPFLHALYLPRGIRDILIIVLTLVVTLVVIPCGVYFLLLPSKIIYLIVTYIVTVLLFGGLYLLVNHRTKERHPEDFRQIRQLRAKQAEKRKQIRATQRNIRKDKDESSYGLEEFNQELEKLEADLDRIQQEKKNALKKFEEETRKAITDELAAEAAKELNPLKSRHEKTYEEQRKTEERIQSLSVTITDRYHTYIGKENMDIAKLDELARIIEAKEATTIGEALSVYRAENANLQKNAETE